MMKNLLIQLLFTFSILLFSTSSNADVTYVHNDMLGSPILETDKQGDVLARFHYKPFGETIESSNDDIGYTGHLNDNDLDLTYMQARYYDPVIGRFYSNDPVGFMVHLNNETGIQGFNRYHYVNNNPYKYIDPDGEALCGGLCIIGVGIGVGMLFDAGIEAIRGEENSASNSVGNAVTGGAVAATGPFTEKPRGGIAGGGPAGTKTSVASKANHKAAKNELISKKTSHMVTKVLRKVPYVGTAIAAGQLVDAVADRIESESSNTSDSSNTSNQGNSGTQDNGTLGALRTVVRNCHATSCG